MFRLHDWLKQKTNQLEDEYRRADVKARYGEEDFRSLWNGRAPQFLSPCHFVLKHGSYWKPQRLPSAYELGDANSCGMNATRLALRDSRLIYVEGYALTPLNVGQGHSWLADMKGNVIEVTWQEPGSEYFGAPFGHTYLRVHVKLPVDTLMMDWKNGWPFLMGVPASVWKDRRCRLAGLLPAAWDAELRTAPTKGE